PQMIHRWSRSINSPRHSKEVDFLHSNFVQYLRDATGNYDTSYPANQVSLSSNSFVRLDLKTSSKTCFFLCISQVHCYYHGEVEGYKNSLVAASTCSGLRYKQLYFIWSQASFVLLLLITGSSFLVPPSVLGSLRFGPSFFFCSVLLILYPCLSLQLCPMSSVLVSAFSPSFCPASVSCLQSVCFSDNNLAFVSTVVAHEMGHNLGMNHDTVNCLCNGTSCIMSGSASGATSFSQCSASDFETLISRGGGVCLTNQPTASYVTECGNGLLENGEQCDCGRPEECKNECCDAATCNFTRGSMCAHGACCDNCQIMALGTPCRKSANTCDLPEYCDGTNEFCPNDFYLMDGLPCENNTAYCYEGRCQTYDYQCRHQFAPGRSSNNLLLFYAFSFQNAMCGKVQCANVDVYNPPPGVTVSIKIVAGKTCVNADFNLGTDVVDPAYVNPGSPCGKGKACLDFQCVNASALLPNLDCDANTTCNSQGVCNDQGHCHCEDGWAPPNCDKSGHGGSIDSGPAQVVGLTKSFEFIIRDTIQSTLKRYFIKVKPKIQKAIIQTESRNSTSGSSSS
uniref:ADAM metallopeptidase domain 9b n=1 Tax=Maylandia zebra TaxID=106582 RepID=A0A3P9AVI3_9CICH